MVISKVALGGLEYYRRALQKIAEEGLLFSLQRTRTPNLAREGSDFDPRSRTSTERLLRRWADRRSLAERQTKPQGEVPDEQTPADRG
jgi:hypothetical protein